MAQLPSLADKIARSTAQYTISGIAAEVERRRPLGGELGTEDLTDARLST